jgi:hypothetical protein
VIRIPNVATSYKYVGVCLLGVIGYLLYLFTLFTYLLYLLIYLFIYLFTLFTLRPPTKSADFGDFIARIFSESDTQKYLKIRVPNIIFEIAPSVHVLFQHYTFFSQTRAQN